MAYIGKTDWQNDDIVEDFDLNRIEQGIIDVESSKVNKAGDTMTGNLNVPTINNIDIVEDRTKRVAELAQSSDYRKSVIALCNLSLGVSGNSFSDGTITLKRANGLYGVISLDVSFEKKSGSEAAWYSMIARGFIPALLKPCVFSYNGVKYAGIEYKLTDSQTTEVEFNGATNFGIFAVDYWNTNTNVAINNEIANSINYTDIYPRDYLSFNLKNVAIYSRGSNANGEWIRFEDGTQICTIRMSVASQNIPVGSKIVEIWTFPSAFVGSPSAAGEINLFSDAGNILSTSLKFVGNFASTELIRVVAINAGMDEFGSTGLTAVSSVFTGIAIGRWK